MPDLLFITGIARSGTNLLGRMLGQHREVAVAMDPLLPALKWFRSDAVALSPGKLAPVPPAAPLDDYYFSVAGRRRLDAVQEAELSLAFDVDRWPALREEIETRAIHECADLVPHLDGLRSSTYAGIWQAAVELVNERRGEGAARWVAIKEQWSVEFAPHFLRAFPGAKVVVLLRDPRAVIASMLKMGERDESQGAQILSYARHWRKLVAFALQLGRLESASDRWTLLRYEDLVAGPEARMRTLCRFLALDYEPTLVDMTNSWDDSRGSRWPGNSSYEADLPDIAPELADRWQGYLPEATVRLIEFLCEPEMALVGYRTRFPALPRGEAEVPAAAFVEGYGAPASWRSDSGDPLLDLGLEMARRSLLLQPKRPARDLIERCFLFETVYDQLVAALAGEAAPRDAAGSPA